MERSVYIVQTSLQLFAASGCCIRYHLAFSLRALLILPTDRFCDARYKLLPLVVFLASVCLSVCLSGVG